MNIRKFVKDLEKEMACNCDLDCWQPEPDTGHSCVCRIHKAARERPKHIQKLWELLGTVPVNDDGEIELDFLHFEPGTDREDIWHWFEDTFNIRVADLLYPSAKEKQDV